MGIPIDIDGEARDANPDIGEDEVRGIDLSTSWKRVEPKNAGVGEQLTYTVLLKNTGILSAMDTVLFDAVPTHSTYASNTVHSTSGTVTDTDGIRWTGTLAPGKAVTITFQVTLDAAVTIVNTAIVTDRYGTPTILAALVNARHVYLPLVLR